MGLVDICDSIAKLSEFILDGKYNISDIKNWLIISRNWDQI